MLSDIVQNMQQGNSAQSACQKLLNKMLGERTYSAQETAHLLLGIPLVRTSVSFQSLNLSKDGSSRPLQEDPDPEDAPVPEGEPARAVTTESWLQRYMNRPNELEELSVQELFARYSWRNHGWRRRRDSTTVILRVYPRYSPNPEDPQYEQYCRTKVLLHHPFRSLQELTRPGTPDECSWEDLLAQCHTEGHEHPGDTLRDLEKERQDNVQDEDDDEEIEPDPDAFLMDEADWQMFAQLYPDAVLPEFDASDLGRRPIDDGWNIDEAHHRWQDIDKMASYIADQRRLAGEELNNDEEAIEVDVGTLEQEQKVIFDYYIAAYRRILQGEQVNPSLLNIDGTAGCGKTYLIRAICQELRQMARDAGQPDPIRVLAPSGVAAWNIGGTTLHSALSIPATASPSVTPLTGTRLATLQRAWKGVVFVVIDEKSMLGLRLFSKVDARLRQLLPQDNPFGGFHVALVGDFAQLPPVGDRPLYSPPGPLDTASERAQANQHGSTLYQMFTTSFRLRIVHRQLGDSVEQQQFRALLEHASNGGLSTDDWKLLLKRSQSKLTAQEQAAFRESMCLFTTTEAVNIANSKELIALNHPCARIKAKHDGGAEAARASPEDAAGLEAEVVLSRGAKVMITRNLWQRHGTLLNDSYCPLSYIQPSRSCERRNRDRRGHRLATRQRSIRSPARRVGLLPDLHRSDSMAHRASSRTARRRSHRPPLSNQGHLRAEGQDTVSQATVSPSGLGSHSSQIAGFNHHTRAHRTREVRVLFWTDLCRTLKSEDPRWLDVGGGSQLRPRSETRR